MHISEKTFNLLKRVEEHQPGTRESFDHPLWDVLGKPGLKLAEVQSIIADLLARRNLRRLGMKASFTYLNSVPPDSPHHPLVTNKARIRSWISEGSLDSMALLCAFLVEAVAFNAYKAAGECISNVEEAIPKFLAMPILNYIPNLVETLEQALREFLSRFMPSYDLLKPATDPIPYSPIVPKTHDSLADQESLGMFFEDMLNKLLDRIEAA